MNLYLRVAIGMLFSLIVSVLAIRLIVVERIHDKEVQMQLRMAGNGTAMVAELLREVDDRQAEVTKMQERFEMPVRIAPASEFDSDLFDASGAPVHQERDGERYTLVALSGDEVLVAGPLIDLRDRESPKEGVIAMSIAVSIVLVTAFLIVTPIGRRLRKLQRATRRLRDGDLGARAEIDGGGAIADLGENINHMAAEIQRLLENQKQLLQAVSHEFRTPTARIRFALEMLDTADSEQDRVKRLEDIDQNLVELDSLVDELLTYVRFDGASPDLRTEAIDVRPVLDEIVASAAVLGDSVDVSVVSHDDSPVEVVANRRYFRRVVENLVRNAIRHANSKVTVEYQNVGSAVLLLVHDDGAGVPKEHRNRVWEPFARLDDSRNRDSGGFGLGLAIVQRIITWHGGDARVEDSKLGGAMFVTTWPVDQGAGG